jgi:Secretion system C-terminal sorting domain
MNNTLTFTSNNMKKVIIILMVASMTYNAMAQAVKEHAFDDQTSINIQMIRLENAGQKICLVNRIDSTSFRYVFYNLDYSEFRTISVNLNPIFIITDYNSPSLYISYIAQNVFDQDPDIDIMGQLTYYDDNNAEYAQVLVFHEDGSILFQSDVDNTNAWLCSSTATNSSLVSSLTNTDAGAKMILDVYYFNEGAYSYDVYGLPGTLPTSAANQGSSDEEPGNTLSAYPVPAREVVHMDYKLNEDQRTGTIEITNAQGQIVKKIQVGDSRGVVSIPVAQYSDGVYSYKLNTSRGVSRSGKMMILK